MDLPWQRLVGNTHSDHSGSSCQVRTEKNGQLFIIHQPQWFFHRSPQTFTGKLLGGFCALAGTFILTLPIPIVVNSFANYYKNRLWRNEVAVRKDNRRKELNVSLELMSKFVWVWKIFLFVGSIKGWGGKCTRRCRKNWQNTQSYESHEWWRWHSHD